VFGEDADDIFVTVKFPDGWEIKATDHSMWSDLLDDKGRKRGAIFYKAAFYDRSAHMNLTRRFSVERDYSLDHDEVKHLVKDCDEVIHQTDVVKVGEGEKCYQVAEKQYNLAAQWLSNKYPNWESPTEYWH
jgi:hypothetical protein